jgi:hypothetical protein
MRGTALNSRFLLGTPARDIMGYNAPMPHAIFIYYGFAIQGTNDISRLGGLASHGCVRLHPAHPVLFALVQRRGPPWRFPIKLAKALLRNRTLASVLTRQ